MVEAAKPKITIGLPVHNGENFVGAVVETILSQTLAEIELIICDDGSTDGTEQVCREYAARDARVRYYRSERNLGAARNFNWTFDFATADYFKWIACDEAPPPDLLERCVAALDAAPDAVLCLPAIGPTGGGGDDRRLAPAGGGPLAGLDAPRPTARFAAAILRRRTADEVFGVIRASALVGTRLHGGFPACERVLVADLALRGRFIAVPDGHHPPSGRDRARGGRRAVPADPSGAAAAAGWDDPSRARWVAMPLWRLYAEYIRTVRRQLTRTGPRLWCYLHLARWLAVEGNGVRLARELAGRAGPRLGALASGARARLLGAALPSLAGGGKPGGSAP